jgi:hypothetical protein
MILLLGAGVLVAALAAQFFIKSKPFQAVAAKAKPTKTTVVKKEPVANPADDASPAPSGELDPTPPAETEAVDPEEADPNRTKSADDRPPTVQAPEREVVADPPNDESPMPPESDQVQDESSPNDVKSPPARSANPSRQTLVDLVPNLISRLPANRKVSEPDPREQGGLRPEIFVRLDEDGDLFLSPEEIPDYYRDAMLAADTNGDGRINYTEFNASIDRLPDPPMARPAPSASALVNPPAEGNEIPTYEPMPQRSAGDVPVWFAGFDRSKDGHIAIYEWPAGKLNEFRALDINNDGFITLEEARKAEALKDQTAQQPLPDTRTRDSAKR